MALNALNWFEIPASNLDRAQTFYNAMYGKDLDVMSMGSGENEMKMVMLPADMEGGVGGCICAYPNFTPGASGPRVYLNANPDLQTMLDRAQAAGATIVMPKTEIGDNIGYMAHFTDSEGNIIALHSQK